MRCTRYAALLAISFVFVLGCAPKKPAEGSASNSSAATRPGSDAALASRGKVVYLEGDVKIDGSAAEIGRELGTKSTIETGNASSCDIVFDEKNAIRVGENTVADLDFSSIVKEVSLKKGSLTSVLKKLAQVAGKDSFRVNTATAVAGVRGTTFFVWADDSSSYICACNGSVHTIDAEGANEQSLVSAHHLARYYTKKSGRIFVTQAGFERHSDASEESLAARIGEKIDWSKSD
jgi:hypothetical protein